MKKIAGYVMVLAVLLVTSGCEQLADMTGNSKDKVLSANNSQVQLRSYQSRAFDTTDTNKTTRTVVATMQDMGFVIDQSDATLGTVSGSKYSGYMLRLTVSVFPKGKTQTQVRANLQRGLRAVEDPKPYQDFFTNLEKAMFLTAHGVD